MASQLPVPGAPATVTAFVDVTVVPMDAERVLPGQTVFVQHGWIIALGPTGQVRVPAGAVRIDGQGKFLIPGLSDCHAHIGAMAFGNDPGLPYLPPDSIAVGRLLRWLADGVTTIRNMDYMDRGKYFLLNSADALRLRARAAAGELWSPRIYTAGQWGPGQYTNFDARFGGMQNIPSPNLDSVAVYVAAYKAAGYDFLKIHEETPAVFDVVLTAARQVGMPVVGHVPNGSLSQAEAGMQSIEHMAGYPLPLGKSVADAEADALVAATRRAGVWNCVTIQLGHSGNKLVRALQDAGAGLLLGSDFPLGTGVHRELELLVKAGLTPYEALATGTKNFAAYLQALDETGTVAVGKRADLVLLEGNPLEDITNIKRRVGVMLGGRWLARDELEQRLLAFPRLE